ncbi:hypothetical protein JCM10908_005397 [Rhodotorula pacifica]|uniref:uncharacterized protein n=1 Tax=Rhodotorula pacifica TaxID=1495444 RepID=UPI00316E27D0
MRLSLFFSGVLAISSVLGVAAQIPDSDLVDTTPLQALHSNEKRSLCIFGICIGGGSTPDYSSDVNNCGRAGNCCPTSWSNGRGAQCVSGVCMPGSCSTGWTLNPQTATCVNLASDVNNCGSVGFSCSLFGASAHSCSGGICQATSCVQGCGLYSGQCKDLSNDPANCGKIGNVCQFPGGTGTCTNGACTLTSCGSGYYNVGGKCVQLNLQTDVNNCGAAGKVCSVANGVAGCSAGQCTVASCATGFAQSGANCVAININTDVRNCGAIGRACSFTNGAGTCTGGVCTYTSCSTPGYYVVGNQCVSLNLMTDPQNCGAFGKVCSVANGVAACSSGTCTVASCASGFQQSNGACVAINTQSDVKNCGAIGKACAFTNGAGVCSNGACTYTSCSTSSGFYLVNGQCVSLDLQSDSKNCCGTCTIASCNSGFQQSNGACVAVNIQSDVKNCGAIGKACAFTNGAGVCSNGACTYTSCSTSSGYYLVNGQCTSLNLQSDPNNCGAFNNVCTVSNGVAGCSSGVCTIAKCNAGYSQVTTGGGWLGLFGYATTSCQAVDTSSDPLNCGAVGKVCSFTNGAGKCSNGACTYTSCATSGLYIVNNQCVSLNLNSDPQNWYVKHDLTSALDTFPCRELTTPIVFSGAVGAACPSVQNGVAGCSSGQCTIASCNAGYAQTTIGSLFNLFGSSSSCQAVNTDSDINNCGKVGNVCPASYLNGGSPTCVGGRCQTSCGDLFDFDFIFGFCRPVASDTANCGKCGQQCNIPNAATQICSSGQCKVTACASGYTLSNNACVAANYQTDPKNCGSAGNVCTFAPSGATGACQAGKCVTLTCPLGYLLSNGKCVLGASGRARAKRDTVSKPKTLCPVGEQACPIAGSTLFEGAASQHFKSGEELTGLMARHGGYECLDTTQSLESCGGCASTGEGRDCTSIPHVGGVGCEVGKCVIFSCSEGYKPSLAGDKCIRVRARTHASHRNGTSSAAARHLAQRAHHPAHHAHGHSS